MTGPEHRAGTDEYEVVLAGNGADIRFSRQLVEELSPAQGIAIGHMMTEALTYKPCSAVTARYASRLLGDYIRAEREARRLPEQRMARECPQCATPSVCRRENKCLLGAPR